MNLTDIIDRKLEKILQEPPKQWDIGFYKELILALASNGELFKFSVQIEQSFETKIIQAADLIIIRMGEIK